MKSQPARARLITIDSCASTSTELDRSAPHGTALMAREQTAGRGQRGNSWEAEAGKNITLSLMLRPADFPAARQFEISEAVALGVADTVESCGVGAVAVKWPNDIYVGDRKIAGILIENALCGTNIARSIAGIGLNVNQIEFRSAAPNPVSLRQLTGREYPLEELALKMATNILERLGKNNHDEFRRRLWRGRGEWPWRTPDGRTFRACIENISPSGAIKLSGQSKEFLFKEVFPIL